MPDHICHNETGGVRCDVCFEEMKSNPYRSRGEYFWDGHDGAPHGPYERFSDALTALLNHAAPADRGTVLSQIKAYAVRLLGR